MARKKARKSTRRSKKRKIPLKLLEKRGAHVVNVILHRGGHIPGIKISRRKVKHRKGR